VIAQSRGSMNIYIKQTADDGKYASPHICSFRYTKQRCNAASEACL
jgi:hypothetical protein